jgi:hypothetical protein
MGSPCPSSVVSLPALSPSSRSNDRVHLGSAYHLFCVGLPPLGEREPLRIARPFEPASRIYTSPFNSFLLARFPSSMGIHGLWPVSTKYGALPYLVYLLTSFFRFVRLLEPAGIPISIRNHAIQQHP